MCVYLPRYWGEVVLDTAVVDAAPDHQGDGERVLVIDDETTIRVLIAEVLQEVGYQVLTKPFDLVALTKKVREMTEAPSGPAA